MNAAIRAVVRTGMHHGIDVYAVAEGYLGLIQGGDAIRRVESADVGGIMQRGGTMQCMRKLANVARVRGTNIPRARHSRGGSTRPPS